MSINTLARVFTPHGNIVYTANDFRQTLRIMLAGVIALSISSFYNTSYGVFFCYLSDHAAVAGAGI
ncbi:Permease of the major facilitator superfamily [Cronobacter sakazakii 680]|nr:Permease of the major facilitator superfamily [Cronobacter sakazakii 680]